MATRTTKAEKLVQEQMLALLEWAAERPKSWHDLGNLPQTQDAADLLAARGMVEIRQPQNQYRLKPEKLDDGLTPPSASLAVKPLGAQAFRGFRCRPDPLSWL
jgi:hypothetical protein